MLKTFVAATLTLAASAHAAAADEAACAAAGQIWLAGACTGVPKGVAGAWNYVGAAYYEHGSLSYHPNYEANGQTLQVRVVTEGGIISAQSEHASGRMGLIFQGFNEAAPNQFLASGGVLTIGTWIEGADAVTNPMFRPIEDHDLASVPANWEWLVFHVRRVGYIYFSRQKPAFFAHPYYVGWRYRTPEIGHNDCIGWPTRTIWEEPDRDRFLKLIGKCLAPENLRKWDYYDEGSLSPFSVLIRAMFRRLSREVYFTECLRDQDCPFEQHLADAIGRATAIGTLIYDEEDHNEMVGILATRVALTKKFDNARLAVTRGTEDLHQDLEFVVDALSVDGTETLLKPVGFYKEDRERIRKAKLSFAGALTMNVGCTLLGLAPGVGSAISLTCGGAGVTDAVNAFHAQRAGERFPDLERTPTVLDLKLFNQAVVADTREVLLTSLDLLEELSYLDSILAEKMLNANIAEKFAVAPHVRLENRKAFWEGALGVMAFLKPTNVRFQSNIRRPDLPRNFCERAPDRGPKSEVKVGARVANSALLVLNEGLFAISEDPRPPENPLEIPSKFRPSQYVPRAYAPAPQGDPLDIPMYEEDRVQVMDWELHVGRVAESRPVDAEALEDLRRFFGNEQIYNIARSRMYFMSSQKVAKIPADNQDVDAFDDPPTVWIGRGGATAYIKRTAAMPEWDQPISYGVYAGRPVNPGSDRALWGVGPAIAGTRCYY